MLVLNFRRTCVGFDFTFFGVIALFICLDFTGTAILGMTACLCHEAGHLFAMLFFRVIPQKITFYGGGIKIIADIESLPAFKQFVILIFGCAVNFLLFFLFGVMGNKLDFYVVMFGIINLLIGCFNLLPVGYFDGKRILHLVICSLCKPKTVIVAERVIGAVCGGLVSFLVIWFCLQEQLNFTALIIVGYLAVSELLSKK